FVAGVLASHSVKLTQAGSGALVKVVTRGGIYTTEPSGVSNAFAVHPPPLDHFTVTDTLGGSVGTQTAGLSFDVKVTALDAFGNVDDSGPNSFSGTVDVTSNKTFSLHDALPIYFVAGVLASHSVKLTQAGSGALVKVVT